MVYPTARYNLNFDVSALCLNVVLFLLYFAKKRSVGERRVKLFLSLILCLAVSSGGELYMSLFRNGALEAGITARTLITALTHYFHNSIGFILSLYLIQLLGISRSVTNRRFTLICLPEFFLTVMVWIPQLRGMMFWYDSTGLYHENILTSVVYYSVAAFYSIYCLSVMISCRKALDTRERVSTILLFVGFVCTIIPALVNVYLRATIFLQSLCVLGIYIAIENDGETYDADTGLRSHYALWKETRALFGSRYPTYVLSVKFRDFKYYEITLGTKTVTGLYHAIGRTLRALVNDRIHIYRPDNDTVAVVMFNATRQEAEKTGRDLIGIFQKEWIVDETPLFVSAQVWISSIPDRIAKEEQLNAFLDAEYDSHIPEGQLYYADELKSAQRRAEVEKALKKALDRDSLEVYYQPIYDTVTGKIHSAEALSRMTDEDLGFVPPDEFIRVAEQTGLIRELGEKVFEKVCRFLAEDKPGRWGLDFIEINLSTVQCMDPGLTDTFISIMDRYGIQPSQISLEITESSVIHDETRMLDAITRLQDAGFSFALDDFGTGNANYSYVMKYPFRLIKIDKSFLWSAEKNRDNEAILLNMLQLVRGLRRLSVVEGVETQKQRDFLTREGVTYLQGFYYSRPIPKDDFMQYMKEFNAVDHTLRPAEPAEAG